MTDCESHLTTTMWCQKAWHSGGGSNVRERDCHGNELDGRHAA